MHYIRTEYKKIAFRDTEVDKKCRFIDLEDELEVLVLLPKEYIYQGLPQKSSDYLLAA
jgi:hypothetical protein